MSGLIREDSAAEVTVTWTCGGLTITATDVNPREFDLEAFVTACWKLAGT